MSVFEERKAVLVFLLEWQIYLATGKVYKAAYYYDKALQIALYQYIGSFTWPYKTT